MLQLVMNYDLNIFYATHVSNIITKWEEFSICMEVGGHPQILTEVEKHKIVRAKVNWAAPWSEFNNGGRSFL